MVAPFSTLCRRAIRFSMVFSLIVVVRFLPVTWQHSGQGLRTDKFDRFRQWGQVYDWFTMMRCKSRSNPHSIANALDTIATGLLSSALVRVTRPKLMVR